jgi:hypothetical protein
VANNSLHLPKMLTLMHFMMIKSGYKLVGYDSLFQQIDIFPKTIMYGNLLDRISAKKNQ